MIKFIRIVTILTTIFVVFSGLAIFLLAPALAIINPFVCTKGSVLTEEKSPTSTKNVIFICTEASGKRVDATETIFIYLCPGILIPLVLLPFLYMFRKPTANESGES